PASRSHSTSGASGANTSAWAITRSPASRNAVGTVPAPSERSMKKANGSGSRTELAPNGVVDDIERHAVVRGELGGRLARQVALDDDVDADPVAGKRWATEAARRINHDRLRLGLAGSHDRKEAHCQTVAVPIDAAKAGLERATHRDLPVSRRI